MSASTAFALGLALAAVHALHCALMCGVFALRARAACSTPRAAVRSARYLSGKAFTYTFLGALAGAAGAAAARQVHAMGAALAILAAFALLGAAVRTARGARAPARVERAFAAALAPAVRALAPLARGPFLLGTLNGFLPCGITVLALAQAAASGSAASGAACMLGLGLGTAPALLAAAFLGERALRWASLPHVRHAAALALVVLSCITFARAFDALRDGDADGAAPLEAPQRAEICGFDPLGVRGE